MRGRVFFDTNVLIYAGNATDCPHRARARALIAEATRASCAVISTQVLQEYFVVSTNKLGVSPEKARRDVEVYAQLDVVIVRPDLVIGAIDLSRLHRLSFWDALILRAAQVAGCQTLYTEDLNHSHRIDGVTVTNPFDDL